MPGFAIGGGAGPSNAAAFHRSHRWQVATLGIPASATGSPAQAASQSGTTLRRTGAGAPGGGRGAGRPISYVKSIQLPSLSFEEEKVMGSSFYYKFAKAAVWEDVTVKFYDVFGQYEDLRIWQRAIWEPIAGLRPATIYKGEPIFELLNNTGAVAQRFKLVNAYPKKISHGELSMTSSEIKILSVTFSFDWAEITIDDKGALNNARGAAASGTAARDRGEAALNNATAAAASSGSRPSRSGQVSGGIGLGNNLSGFSLGSSRTAGSFGGSGSGFTQLNQ